MEGYKNILANKYMRDTNYIIIKDTDNLEDLEDQWNKFTSLMTTRQQRLSDDRSIEIYNMTNQQHYESLKNAITKSLSAEIDDAEPEEEFVCTIDPTTKNYDWESGEVVKEDGEERNIRLNDEDKITDCKNNDAEQYELSSNMNIVSTVQGSTASEKLADLEREFIDFNSQSHDLRKKADDKCRELFGMSNQDRYNKLKVELLGKVAAEEQNRPQVKPINSQDEKNDPIPEKLDVIDNKHFSEGFVGACEIRRLIREEVEEKERKKTKRLVDTPYFTPWEMIDMGVHGNNNYYDRPADNDGLTTKVKTPTWFASYQDMCMDRVFEDYRKEWIDKLTELYSDYEEIKESGNQDDILARKQSILDLGWNPEIPFTTENRIKASERVSRLIEMTVPKDIFINLDSVPDPGDDYVAESVSKSTHEPVFLVLTKGKTPIISQGIKAVTHSEYSHASISFDPELEEVYSYNMRREAFGFIREDITSFKDNVISVFAFFLDKMHVNKLKETVKDFESNKTTFDLRIFFNKIFHINKKVSNNEYKQVCSTFVDTVLKSGGVNLVGDQQLPAPGDLYNGIKSRPNKIIEVYNGIAPKYNGKKVKRQVNYLLSDGGMLAVNEACKDLKSAREFVSKVGELAKKYDANYFIVTDGASGIHNDGNPAVKNARDSQIKWEKKNGFDPDEDWSKNKSLNEAYNDTSKLYKAIDDVIKSLNKSDYNDFDKRPKNIYHQVVKYDGKVPMGFAYSRVFDEGNWLNGHKNGVKSITITIAVNPNYRGQGLAFKMSKEIINKAESDPDILNIYWSTLKSNKSSIDLAKKLGFVHYYDYKDSVVYVYKEKRESVNESSNIYYNIEEEDSMLLFENLNDIPNGVNPYSKKTFFHVSFDEDLDEKTLTPRIPSWIQREMKKDKDGFIKDMEKVKAGEDIGGSGYEEYKTPRVCFSNSINGCLNGIIGVNERHKLAGKTLYVYVPEKPINQYKYKTNKSIKKDGDIFDSNITNEMWILEPVKVRFYGTIVVDKVTMSPIKRKFANNKHMTIEKFTYKWHWFYRDKKKYVNESVSVLNEVHRFPVEFDDDGNLTIYKCTTGNIDYGDEIHESVQLLEQYRNTNNEVGMKYELCRVWFIITSIEKKMKKKLSNDKYQDLVRHRTTALNVFKTNMEYVMKIDNDFNFTDYYNNTPFAANGVKISGSTLKYSMAALKSLLK